MSVCTNADRNLEDIRLFKNINFSVACSYTACSVNGDLLWLRDLIKEFKLSKNEKHKEKWMTFRVWRKCFFYSFHKELVGRTIKNWLFMKLVLYGSIKNWKIGWSWSLSSAMLGLVTFDMNFKKTCTNIISCYGFMLRSFLNFPDIL